MADREEDFSRKTALTPQEKITAAFMHYVRRIDQQDIAMMYGVNMARVNDACRDIGIAVKLRPIRVVEKDVENG
jgi:hypothetical protein